MPGIENIRTILDRCLGSPKNDYCGSGGWYEYNCPHCAAENGGGDGKYNLAVRVSAESKPYFHCWKCGYSGKLGALVRENGSADDYSEFKSEYGALKDGMLYTLEGETSDVSDSDSDSVSLPEGFRSFDNVDEDGMSALAYLHSRGIDDSAVRRFGIGYVGRSSDWTMARRIVIPSYDRFGDLNYWVARDYTGSNRYKVKNCDAEKKSVVFNEGMVNWYEDVTLVEGPFDHFAVPNSIPLLGKTMDVESAVYKAVVKNAFGNVNIFLDDDAFEGAMKIYRLLDSGRLHGRIRFVRCPDERDAADIYAEEGWRGVAKCLSSAMEVDEYDLQKYRL